jgi:hypothetical protein
MTLEAALYNLLSSIPPWLAVIFIAALPVGELRLSIPIAILKFRMDPISAFSLSIYFRFFLFSFTLSLYLII